MGDRQEESLILLTGATGYVGGRLLKELEARGHAVRCMTRRPEEFRTRAGTKTSMVRGDVLDEEDLLKALQGVQCAYYLVHSMGSAADFREKDRRAADGFAKAARKRQLEKIIYLGGLGQAEEELSPHLASRQEVGRILRESGVPTIEFRASIILGSGSLSFEMIRSLVDRLPVMITPRWVRTLAQPIAIDDVLAYLLAALDFPVQDSEIFEIGGPERLSYADIMREYARQRGLKRLIIPVPLLTPRLSSLWLGLVTPIFARVGRKLVESLRHPTVVTDPRALEVFQVRPLSMRQAIARALENEDREIAETRWSDSLSSLGAGPAWGGVRFGSRLVDSHSIDIAFPPTAVFPVVESIGGKRGWYYANRLWKLRGLIDLLFGGPGMRRGRRDPRRLAPGETLDCWRVEEVERNRLLRLRSEMKMPGRAWLQFEVRPSNSGSHLRQTAIFDPVGLAGNLYWYSLYPAHRLIFEGMLREIARRVRRQKGRVPCSGVG